MTMVHSIAPLHEEIDDEKDANWWLAIPIIVGAIGMAALCGSGLKGTDPAPEPPRVSWCPTPAQRAAADRLVEPIHRRYVPTPEIGEVALEAPVADVAYAAPGDLLTRLTAARDQLGQGDADAARLTLNLLIDEAQAGRWVEGERP